MSVSFLLLPGLLPLLATLPVFTLVLFRGVCFLAFFRSSALLTFFAICQGRSVECADVPSFERAEPGVPTASEPTAARLRSVPGGGARGVGNVYFLHTISPVLSTFVTHPWRSTR